MPENSPVKPVTPQEAMDYGNAQHRATVEKCITFTNHVLCQHGKQFSDGEKVRVAPSTQEFPLYGEFVACAEILVERFKATGWAVSLDKRESNSPYPPKELIELVFSK